MKPALWIILTSLIPVWASGYPLYGSESANIGRLEQARLGHEGLLPGGRKKISGEPLSVEQVVPRLAEHADFELPKVDSAFTEQIKALLADNLDRYQISVLDLSDPSNPRYAEHRGDVPENPGSVGKIMVAIGVFQALADAWGDDVEARERILRETVLTADEFIHKDHHPVRMWDPATQVLTRRRLAVGDRATLNEYLDWMLSASANAAAAMLQKQAMLIKHFGQRYPVPADEAELFFKETDRKSLTALYRATFDEAVIRNGLNIERLRQGSFFTRTGKKRIQGSGRSYATTRELMKAMVKLEAGQIVDAYSSREIKRLLYMTERRIRYASSPALRDAAVYFKSGSLYSCEPEPGFKCKKYHGNKKNFMNSVAVVESPAGTAKHFYIVTMMSNVLRKNSAVDHQTLATRIHRLIEAAHP